MKQLVILFLFFGLFSCVQEQTIDSTPETTKTSIEKIDSTKGEVEIEPVAIIDSNIVLFKNQFKFNFPQTIDFGWRFIASNYENNHPKVKGTPYNEKFDLNKTSFYDVNGKPLAKEIKGYAHSYKRISSDSLLFLTMIQGEISQEFMLYLTNNKLKVLKQEQVASNGGDEGSWYYKFGSFDSSYSYYISEELDGFAQDTMERIKDTLWIRSK